MRSAFVALAMIVGSGVVPALASTAPNLVQNGNLNQTSYTTNNQFGTAWSQPTMQGVTDWTGNGGYDLYYFNGKATTNSANSQYDSGYNTGAEKLYGTSVFTGTSPHGDNFVAFDADTTVNSAGGGGMSQTITGMTIGETYQLSFVWAASQLQSETGATTETLTAKLGSAVFVTPTLNNASNGFNGWYTQVYNYVATSTTAVLSFVANGTPAGDPPVVLLTDISLQQVPEPGTMAVLGVGLMGLLVARRSRRVPAVVRA